ncbi:ribokinase [Pontibacillus yanchengensis]|uniref:Ribokinase n=1 Tax=Pontibacillus yanchengensis Y32 TaxID=1385514 RepID=A0A0A2TT14_9BACI|nr:ribokinase [Pontibacillus yanchengensis]KGP72380.1 ribokinase [Pontibacillus yanchengensis Y32]
MTPSLTVVGSINMDLVTSTERVPNQGETVLGYDFATYPGGKGANQAVSASRLGAKTNMIGAVGSDAFGQELTETLRENGVVTENVKPVTDIPSGTATIILSDGDNRIIVNPGANHSVTPDYIESCAEVLRSSNVVLMQLEIPLETVEKAAKLAKEGGATVILNPAPIQALPKSLLQWVDIVTPNESEAKTLLNHSPQPILEDKLMITKGSEGVLFYENGKERHIPAYHVEPVDTTGAGDAFNGALAFKLSEGCTKQEAISYANAVAALSVLKSGAQTGLPTQAEVQVFLEHQGEQT